MVLPVFCAEKTPVDSSTSSRRGAAYLGRRSPCPRGDPPECRPRLGRRPRRRVRPDRQRLPQLRPEQRQFRPRIWITGTLRGRRTSLGAGGQRSARSGPGRASGFLYRQNYGLLPDESGNCSMRLPHRGTGHPRRADTRNPHLLLDRICGHRSGPLSDPGPALDQDGTLRAGASVAI